MKKRRVGVEEGTNVATYYRISECKLGYSSTIFCSFEICKIKSWRVEIREYCKQFYVENFFKTLETSVSVGGGQETRLEKYFVGCYLYVMPSSASFIYL